LNKIQKARLEADYNRMIDFTEPEARTALADAEDFVAMVEALISILLAERASERAEGESGDATEPTQKKWQRILDFGTFLIRIDNGKKIGAVFCADAPKAKRQ